MSNVMNQIMLTDEIEVVRLIALEQIRTIASLNEEIVKLHSLNPAYEPKVIEIINMKENVRVLQREKSELLEMLKSERKSRKVLERLCKRILESGCDEC